MLSTNEAERNLKFPDKVDENRMLRTTPSPPTSHCLISAIAYLTEENHDNFLSDKLICVILFIWKKHSLEFKIAREAIVKWSGKPNTSFI